MFAFFQSWIQTNVAANIHSKYRYNVLALIQVSVLNLMKSFHIEQPERKWCACINLVNFSALIKKIAFKIRKKKCLKLNIISTNICLTIDAKSKSEIWNTEKNEKKTCLPLTVLSKKQATTPPHRLGLTSSIFITPSLAAEPKKKWFHKIIVKLNVNLKNKLCISRIYY